MIFLNVTPVYNFFHKNIVQDLLMYNEFAQTLRKQATMNRKHSGLFAAIWYGVAKGLKCWSI